MTAKKKVYIFYSIIIAASIFVLVVSDLNLYFKFILAALILLCLSIMNSVRKAPVITDEELLEMEGEEEYDNDEKVQ